MVILQLSVHKTLFPWFMLYTVTRGRHGRDRMVVGTYAISAYHHCCEFKSQSRRGVCDKVCQ